MPEPTDRPHAEEAPYDEGVSEKSRLRAKRTRARQVLFVAGLVIALGLGTRAVWPWLLPAFVYEGPMVQMASEHEATLVWYMSKPVQHDLSVRLGNEAHSVPAESDGCRCRAVLTDLAPGTSYPYEISLGRRTLARHEFRTSKLAGEPFTFVVFGDSGRGTQEQYRLAAQMAAADPDFALHTGDLVYGAGERRKYKERFFTPYREMIRRVNFWPSLGNHDIAEPSLGEPYLEVFELPENGPVELPPERNYWFDYASARIAIVDSNLDETALREHVSPWLREVLTASDARWKFVVFHHPPYTGGAYEPDRRIQRTLVPVFEATDVDIVFTGHEHMYQRMHPIRNGEVAEDGDGVVYVISGAGGARLYEPLPPDQRPPYVASVHHETHSFTLVSVTGHELTLEQIALGGEVLDRWTLRKAEPSGVNP